jgi:O-antigen/teichoic acid export membrane protein
MLEATGPLRLDIARAAFASGTVEMVTRALMIVLSIATARLLQPSEVGLLGLAVIIVGVLSVVAFCAETAGVIGRGEGTDQQHALMAVAARGLITACLLVLALLFLPTLAHLLAGVESASAELMALVHLLIWQLGLELAATYPRVLLQRRLSLTSLAGASLLQISAHVGLSLVLLWWGYGAMGMASSALVSGGLSAAFLWSRLSAQTWPPWRGGCYTGLWGQTLGSTGSVFVASFVGYLNGRLDNILVAAVVGPAAMSFYAMAWSASRIPISVLIQGMGMILVPTLARIQGDAERVGKVLRQSLRHSYLLLAPVVAMLCVSGPSLVAAVLGTKWLPLVPCLRVMSVSILLGPLAVACHAVLLGVGRPHVTGLATGAQLCAIVVLVPPLVGLWGIVGAAMADAISMTILTAVLFATARGVIPQVKWEFVTSAGVPVLAALSVGLLALSLGGQFSQGLFQFACEVAVIAVGYPAVIAALGGRARLAEFLVLLRDASGRVAGSRISV